MIRHIIHNWTKRGCPVYNTVQCGFVQTGICKKCGKIRIRVTKGVYGYHPSQIEGWEGYFGEEQPE